jgi:hypothetical protein
MIVKVKNALLAAAIVAVLTVLAAQTAFAWGWGGYYGRMWGPHTHGGGLEICHGQYGVWEVPDVPQDIKNKWMEAQKTAIDLETELCKRPVDRAKALELHAKFHSLMRDVSDWHFKQRLDALTAR